MGDMAEDFRAMDIIRRQRRERLGIKCPACIKREPKRNPTILLPGQKCFCGYRDSRPRDHETATVDDMKREMFGSDANMLDDDMGDK